MLLKENSFLKRKINTKARFFYTFRFCSIFYPGSLKNITLFTKLSTDRHDTIANHRCGSFKNTKILVKQSYILAVWMHYLTTNNYNDPENINCKIKPSFFVYPYKQSKLTIVKAPIAHKTFSQEQFLTRYYRISISFVPEFKLDNVPSTILNSVNSSVYASYFIKSNIPFVSTNMLFLKKMSYFYNAYDCFFFSMRFFKNVHVNK